MAYASGKFAYALCDRCGFRYKYKDLRKEWNGAKTCRSCYEEKHPQLETTRNVTDPEALYEARPNTDKEVGNGRISTNNDLVGKTFLGFKTNSSLGSINVIENDNSLDVNVAGIELTSALGSISITGNISETVTLSTLLSTSYLNNPSITGALQTYTVTVVGGNPVDHPYYNFGSTNKFAINGYTATPYVTLSLAEGETYRFDQSNSSNSGHPLRFSTTANGTHGGGSEYTTGVTTNGTPGSSGAYTQITVASGAPTLYYYCTNHSGMGWTANVS